MDEFSDEWLELVKTEILNGVEKKFVFCDGGDKNRELKIYDGMLQKEDILKLYPYLEPEDIDEALAYAAWRVEEIDVPLDSATA